MLKILKELCLKIRWPDRRQQKQKPKQKVVTIQKLGNSNSRTRHHDEGSSAVIHPSSECNGGGGSEKPIRIATFNAALFSMAPAVPKPHHQNNGNSSSSFDFDSEGFTVSSPPVGFRGKSMVLDRRPKGILKQSSPLHSSSMRVDSGGARIYDDSPSSKQKQFAKSKLRVSINLPDNEISLRKSGQLTFAEDENSPKPQSQSQRHSFRGIRRTILEVLTELNADVLALQDVRAEEEKGMSPLSDLAEALGMHYAFAESWAPEYGNAVLSRWPIKKWKSHKICDDSDFRNVLKATIDVPDVGEFDFYCTHLDHLDENWRMKQINAILQASETPHILAGGINSLEESDYSAERWTDIIKYYEEIGKPIPKLEVMKHLKNKQYTDAKDFAGECESVVMIAKGQSVQGTCKYGTRVDYVLSSPRSPYKFVPGSYSVFSSKGTSDHHIVKVDVVKVLDSENDEQEFSAPRKRGARKKVVKITHNSSPAKGIWKGEEAIPYCDTINERN